ncbi:MAG: type III pantothenate kinase, partial [Nitrospirota bacterium]|nr:type III pantothenate kinase [Nitrospirota bacterium]
GIDRLVNAAAVWSRYRKAVIVVDFGTATTFNAISGKGEYMGGAIFPGLGMSAVSLAERTARLPLVEPQRPARVIGRSTEECIHSALYYGYAGLVERMVARMKEEMGEDATVVATGGMAGTIEGECRVIDKMDPHLTLDGLRIILEREMAHHDGRGCETASSNKEVTA